MALIEYQTKSWTVRDLYLIKQQLGKDFILNKTLICTIHTSHSLGVFRFLSASQKETKPYQLVVLGKVNLGVILFRPDLLAGAENRPL